ncbi:MAG: molybdopterin-binding protein [Nitrospirae bacterium CG_4_9_14_3_um_filter_53_35]|nr:MAG: molybdopterin-binding protein [Nitrospirae bacterium CG2_30_53_67]PIS38064.1 MAG: molybdopterin-binding protein [Nitrospirae bacterium CG08_land_8_20_14_0_20_52_24]PIV85682.1 MAG: molybdopterin-binding protein [Nitrospirae bacterium CG17_big_fil_post_rev_8_21_14_2_50_50_9]PIW85431.1 MAG: molybdopterin-binding protein [Nitrospirae bacterium CG_4_8_14_3_um_filter_50_41]PIX87020.1 MAG: molybdopterin-binding protein [Nitrospirae bacterium CG_4_10_14_3_um_filter_53_41]PJA74796.1 MAG: molybd
MVKTLPVHDAVGTVLAHDITEIIPGQFKGRAFKKGHIITESDIEHLKNLGKEHLYVLEIGGEDLHENDAAVMLASALAGRGIMVSKEPKEGKLELTAAYEGLLKVNVQALYRFNLIGEVMCATRHTNTYVKKGEILAGTRAIPLVIHKKIIEKAVAVCKEAGGVLHLLPLRKAGVGVVITGNEVYHGRIKDRFRPVIQKKVEEIGSSIVDVRYAPDERKVIAGHIRDLIGKGADLIVTTGGMSVDPDDVTRLAVADAGAEEITYGSSVLPGAMLMVAYMGDIPVIGVPACGMFHDITLFDLILPRVLAGERIGREALAALGHGGLCLNCETCRFPVCPFGQ